jgi:hypothetical protein
MRYLYVLLFMSFINLPSAFAQNESPNIKYEWYIPQEADSKLAWNSHDPWNEWGSSLSIGLDITKGHAFKDLDDGVMTGFSFGLSGVSFAYVSNTALTTYRISILANQTLASDKLSVDLLNPDLRVSLMLPTMFFEFTTLQNQKAFADMFEGVFAVVAGVDILNIRAVYEDLVFFQLSLGSFTYGFENIPTIDEFGDKTSIERDLANQGFNISFRIIAGVSF